MKLRVPRAQNEDLLVDDLDAQRLRRANYAFDDSFKGGVPHFEALILGFHLGNLVHCSHRHHPRCLVAFTQKRFQNGNLGKKKNYPLSSLARKKTEWMHVCLPERWG